MRNGTFQIILWCIFFLSVSLKVDNPSSQLKDFAVFKEVLLSKEGTLNLHTNLDSIYYHLDLLEKNLQSEQSILTQFKLYSRLLSKIQCGHTQIHANKEVLREWLAARNSLPNDFYLVGKHLVVNELLPEDIELVNEGKSSYERTKKIEAGSEIISIDGKDIYELMLGISSILSSDENTLEFKYFQITHVFDFFRHMTSPFSKDSVKVKFIKAGDTSSIYFVPGTAPVYTINDRLEKSSDRSKQSESSFGEFSIDGNVGYFRFRSFKSSFGSKYEAFLKNSFEQIKRKKLKKLIVDLRGNTGGAMQYSIMRYFVGEGVVLGKYIVGKPKNGIENRSIHKMSSEYRKHRRMSHTQTKLIRQGKFDDGLVMTKKVNPDLVYEGEIIIITDQGTFSSASILACHIKTLRNAKIVGSQAGGSFYSGNAGTLLLRLPNSKLAVLINPNTFYSQLESVKDPTLIKKPDLKIDTLIIDRGKRDIFYIKKAQQLFD